MNAHKTHEGHDHDHGPGCGHTALIHDGHVDYLHDGHLHHSHEDHVDEHVLPITGENPDDCSPVSEGHEQGHVHSEGCGHEAVPHGDHVDYLVGSHLHHPHGDHCDDHGEVKLAD